MRSGHQKGQTMIINLGLYVHVRFCSEAGEAGDFLHSLHKTPKLWGRELPDWSTDPPARRVIHFSFLVIETPALETLPDLVRCVSPSGC